MFSSIAAPKFAQKLGADVKILSASLVRLMPLIWIFLTFFPGFGLVDAADIKAVKPNPSPSPPVINTEEVVVVKRMPNPAAPFWKFVPKTAES